MSAKARNSYLWAMKILVIRFSSIGDIVLCTPVIRALKQQLPNAEIHFITKKSFQSIVAHNPYIDRLYLIEKNPNELVAQLKKENYDHIIDLHNNLRTLKLKHKLGVPSHAFPKLNIQKWILVNFKINRMPKLHVVYRYFETVAFLGVQNDGKPCDFFLGEAQVDTQSDFALAPGSFIAFAIGAQFATKRMPITKMVEVIDKIDLPVVILGGKMDEEMAQILISLSTKKNLYSACGKYNLLESGSIVKQCKALLTHDTGLMHIASAFSKPVISVWGNTIPDLGFYPYYPDTEGRYTMHEVENLSCRPCSKIGFQKCPKGHFKCMNLQDANAISQSVNQA